MNKSNILTILKKAIIAVLICGGFFVIQGIATVAALIIKCKENSLFGPQLMEALNNLDYMDIESVNTYMKLLYEMTPIVLFITGAIILIPISIYLFKKKKNVGKRISLQDVIRISIIGIALNVIVSFIIELLPNMVQSNYEASVGYIDMLPFMVSLLAIGIITPIVEEIIFRYFMVNTLIKYEKAALILPAIIFGIAHGNLVQSLYAILFGVLFNYIYIKTKNLYITILLHISINASSIIFVYLPTMLGNAAMGIITIMGLHFMIQVIKERAYDSRKISASV